MKLSCVSVLAAVAMSATAVLNSQAAPFIYEPFDYANVSGLDRNSDDKKDLMGFAGGVGWFDAWRETTGASTTAQGTHALDYIENTSLSEPSGDSQFSLGGSARMLGYKEGGPYQTSSRLLRSFAEPITLNDRTELWFSILLRKDSEYPYEDTGLTREGDRIEISLLDPDKNIGFSIADPSTGTSYEIHSGYSISAVPAPLAGRGPILGNTDLLVLKLTLASGSSQLEFFLNPSLASEPTVPVVALPLHDTILASELTGIQISSAFNINQRPVWALDEIRVGNTYADVIPEPSSLLLAGFGVAMLGGARLRKSSVVRG